MNVQVINGLASYSPVVDPDIETSGGVLVENELADDWQSLHQFLLLFPSIDLQVENLKKVVPPVCLVNMLWSE